MNLVLAVWNLSLVFVLLLGTGSTRTAFHPQQAQVAAKTNLCSAPEYHSFDFWVGDWDTFDVDNPNKKIAHNRVERILGDCVLLEDYQSAEGEHGQSFTIYDASRKVWHQTWVTNEGVLLVIEGGIHGDEMVLSGTDLTADGHKRYVRGTWKQVSGGVREVAATSIDGGKTWKPWFDIIFRPTSEKTR